MTLNECAQPGDDDLDLDVDGITLTAVVVDKPEILVRFTGGFGTWICVGGTRATFAPGDDEAGVQEGEIHVVLNTAEESAFELYVMALERWRDRAVPLRLTASPTRMSRLAEDEDNWLPVPRRAIPENE